jgi:outer membrane receptor protein involved in Fe transport
VLYQVPISGLTGVTSIWKNIGKMQNRGIELTIGGDIVRNDNVHWSLDVNLSHNVNKLTELFATKDANGNLVSKPIIAGDGSGIAGSAQRLLQPGLPVDTYYLKEWAGVNVDNGLPMWYDTRQMPMAMKQGQRRRTIPMQLSVM